MQLNVLPTKNNTYAKRGLLIKGSSPERWLKVVQKCNLSLDEVIAFPVPSSKANELYGCFIYGDSLKFDLHLSNVIFFQCVQNLIFIPEYTTIHPQISKNEAERLFDVPHIFHPDLGWFAMESSLNWMEAIQLQSSINIAVIKPMTGTVIPKHIFKLYALAKDEKEIEKELDLPLEKLSDKGLSALDKMRLGLYKSLFRTKKRGPGQFEIEERGFMKIFNKISSNKSKTSKWSQSMDALMTRNSKQADRLLAMFAKNPQLAMKFAIPLDLIGSTRDSGKSRLSFGKIGSGSRSGTSGGVSSFSIIFRVVFVFMIIRLVVRASSTNTTSGQTIGYIIGAILLGFIIYLLISNLFNSEDNTGGTATIHDDRMEALRKQYEKLIEEEKKNGNYRKAAAMQIKLLGSHWLAAQTLNEGKFYEEAAYIHLKYNKNKQSAAQSYEKGKFYEKAITLYKELNNKEKVGDLYKESGNKDEANHYYKLIVNQYLEHNKFVDASIVYKEKIEDIDQAQRTLLNGWRKGKEQNKCIHAYFETINDPKEIEKELTYFYKQETNSSNVRIFIKALKKHKDITPELGAFSKNLMYQIINKYHKTDPGITFELSSFDKSNHMLYRDSNIFVREEKKRKRKR